MRRWLILLVVLLPGLALAADRHVLLDTDGNDVLNDCPNPAHNSDASAGSTDDLQYCSGGDNDGKIIGTADGRVGSCPGGSATNVTNGVSADYDGDGTAEPLYGHPQACVWNMAKSDSCEVHAGVYEEAGAECNGYCGDTSVYGGLGSCVGSSCWRASIIAMGYGPNMSTDGYGTEANPGLVQGALQNSSRDTWDADGDKRPDTCLTGVTCPAIHDDPDSSGYPVIISGNADGDANKREATACSGNYTDPSVPTAENTCSGDAFFGVLVGCYWDFGEFCFPSSEVVDDTDAHPAVVDTDADGVVDTYASSGNARDTSYLQFRHLAFTEYGPGNGNAGGSRSFEATIGLHGSTNDTNGLDLDTIAIYENAPGSTQANPGSISERTWASISTNRTGGTACAKNYEIANSFFQWTNRRFFVNDCGGGGSGSPDPSNAHCGCPVNFHDNLVEVNYITKPYEDDSPNPPIVIDYMFYLKPFGNDNSAGGYGDVGYRIYNNDFFFNESDGLRFFDVGTNIDADAFIYFYGNIIRTALSTTRGAEVDMVFQNWDGHNSGKANTVNVLTFNNTVDANVDEWNNTDLQRTFNIRRVRQNAFFLGHYIGKDVWVAATEDATGNFCYSSTNNDSPDSCTVTASSARADWFTGSSAQATPYIDYAAEYTPATGAEIENAGSCDPDGDGTNGFDYDGDGTPDTSWTDIAGNTVDCSSPSNTIHAGAVQGEGAPGEGGGGGGSGKNRVVIIGRQDTAPASQGAGQ